MKLDDIHKKNIYTTPESYFEKLPNRIQERVTAKEKQAWFTSPWVRIATPAFAVAIALFIILNPKYQRQSADILESVSTSDLASYLELTDNNAFYSLEGFSISNTELQQVAEDMLFEIEMIDSEELEGLSDEELMLKLGI